MSKNDVEVKRFSSSKQGKNRIAQATSAAIAQQIEDTRPAILSELGRVCESRGGRLTDEQVAAIAAVISHLHHPSEIFARLAEWLENNKSIRELAKAWLKTYIGQQCVANAWYAEETRRDLPKEALTGIMAITDEEAEALGLVHLVSDRLRKRLDRRAEGIQARKKDEPWKEQGISKAAYYRKQAAAKVVSPTEMATTQLECQPWVELGISRATYFRKKTKETAKEIGAFDTISHSETPGETPMSGSHAHARDPSSSFLYISGRSSLTSSLTPITAPTPLLTDPIACARTWDRGDDHYYFIVASRDTSKRLCDLQHLGPELLMDFEDIENGEYSSYSYSGIWAFQSHVSFFPQDVDLEPKPIELIKQLKSSPARQFAHKALKLGLTWEDPAYWNPENPWTWFIEDERSNAADVHAALAPLAERFWRALKRTEGIAGNNARKAAQEAEKQPAIAFDVSTMHPPCCSKEDWSAVPLPLRNRALMIAGDLFISGAWQQMDCLAIGIIGTERAETRRKILAELCPAATPVELETAAINSWQLPISKLPELAASLNEHAAERIRLETAHLHPSVIERLDWIMAQEWAKDIIPGGVDRDKIRNRMATVLIDINEETWQSESKEILRTAVKRANDPRFAPTTKADEDYIKALAKREIMTMKATVTRK